MPIHKEFNKNYFKKWSKNMAYILGYIFADGNIVKTKRGTHFLAIYSSDYSLIVSIREIIGSNHKIGLRNSETGGVYVLQIGSRELFDNLGKFGLVPNKARRMLLPKIPRKYLGDFVRGYFDGDGCVWTGVANKITRKKSSVITVCFTSASYEFLYELFLSLKRLGIVGGSLFKSKKGKYSRLSFCTQDALKIYRIMYNAQNKLFLDRKKLVFEKYMNLRS